MYVIVCWTLVSFTIYRETDASADGAMAPFVTLNMELSPYRVRLPFVEGIITLPTMQSNNENTLPFPVYLLRFVISTYWFNHLHYEVVHERVKCHMQAQARPF